MTCSISVPADCVDHFRTELEESVTESRCTHSGYEVFRFEAFCERVIAVSMFEKFAIVWVKSTRDHDISIVKGANSRVLPASRWLIHLSVGLLRSLCVEFDQSCWVSVM